MWSKLTQIVDLIRSDLLSCCVPSTVVVPQLIALESYGVHNLVTTVRGRLAEHVGPVEATKRCFPPGSMTGAPKLRSVQLLDEFEERYPRGIYSGALGYFSLCGSADLSVVIRTMVLEGNGELVEERREPRSHQTSALARAGPLHGSRTAKRSGPRCSQRYRAWWALWGCSSRMGKKHNG